MRDAVLAARRWRWLPWSAAAITFIAFIPVLSAGFVSWDDVSNFTANNHYRGLGTEQLSWMWTTFLMGHYAPMTWMTLGFDYTVWGMDARGYHLTNLLLHCVNAMLVYQLARQLLAKTIPDATPARLQAASIIGALLFAVHPLRVESVAWITERRDVLSMMLALASILLYLRATQQKGMRDPAYYAAVVCFICALLSKATVMTLPVVLAVLNVYPLGRLSAGKWRSAQAWRIYLELLPFALPSAGMVALSLVALHPPDQLPFAQKIAVSAYSLMFYVWKSVVPWNLAPLYEMPKHVLALSPKFLASYLFCVIYGTTIILARKKWPGVSVSLILFLVITLPMLGVVQNGPQIAADRYTYHAGPALSVLGGAAVLAIGEAAAGMATVIAGVCVALLGVLTWNQATIWQSSEALWKRVLAVDENTSLGQMAYADLLMKRSDVSGAVEHYRRSIAIDPASSENHNNLGLALVAQGKTAEANTEFARALALRPQFGDADVNLGALLARDGDLDGAIEHYAHALSSNPDMANAHVNWANALVRQGRTDEAIVHYERALQIRPDDAEAHSNWGVALARKGEFAAAIVQFREALRISPDNAEARLFLGRALAQIERGQAP